MKRNLIIIILIFIVFSSCRKEFELPVWETNILTPLLKSSLTIDNLITDSLITENSDSSISIVYEYPFYSFTLDTLLDINDTTYVYSVKLEQITMNDLTIVYPISLGQIASQLIDEGNFLGYIIILMHGQDTVIDPITGMSSDDFDIDATSYFETMTLDSGWLDLYFDNGLPIDITNFHYRLRNKYDSAIIAENTIPIIPAGTTVKDSASLAGKTVEGTLVGKIINMDSPGSYGQEVLIDTNDALIVTLVARDLKPISATAIFPAQNIIDKDEELVFSIPDVDLAEAVVLSGNVKLEAYNTIDDSVHFVYQIPGATKNGIPFYTNGTIPPATQQGASYYIEYYDINGYSLDLTGINHNTKNRLHQHLTCFIDSTGEMKNLTLNDSIYFNYGLTDIEPYFVRGYFGNHQLSIGPEISNISLFNKFINGEISLDDVLLSISIENSIGTDATLIFNNLVSINTRTNNTVTLSGNIVGKHNHINRALNLSYDNVIPSYYSFILNQNNSNIAEFISNLPNQFEYDINVQVNPLGNVSGGNDFFYHYSNIKTNFNMEIPLSLIANNLTLCDTVDFNLNNNSNSNIKSGTLTLFVDNGFPFQAVIQLYMLDEISNFIDSLLTENNMIAPALVDANYKVYKNIESKIIIPLSENKINELFNTKKMRIIANFTTKPENIYLKIYSHYQMDFLLTADFIYHFENN